MARILLACIALVASAGAAAPGHGICPEKNGKFAVPDQCDAYIECIEGVAEEKLCSDGLVFNDQLGAEGECQFPPGVDCGNRSKLQPAQPTADCPHQFGLFRYGDPAHCGQYINCANGNASISYCPEGLAFNSNTWRCDWPDEVSDCNPEAYLRFTCPPSARSEPPQPNDGDELQYFASEEDCRHYFVCVNGHPRLYNCGYCMCPREVLDRGTDVLDAGYHTGQEIALKDFSLEEVLKIQLPKKV